MMLMFKSMIGVVLMIFFFWPLKVRSAVQINDGKGDPLPIKKDRFDV